MELLLWRHAEALDGSPDRARKLSPQGKKQAEKMADWLRGHGPENLRLLVSPAVRTRQTAEFFQEEMEICEALSIDAKRADILSIIKNQDAQTPLLLVGHQPLLGRIAAQLMKDGTKEDDTEALEHFKKGALWWLRGKPNAPMTLWKIVDADALQDADTLLPAVSPKLEDEEKYQLASLLEKTGKYRRAFKLFRRLSKQGNSAAMTRLVSFYDKGYGVKQSRKKMLEWEKRAAKAGDAPSLFNLGLRYRQAGDVRQAQKWFEKALAAGEGAAALEIAKMYLISPSESGRVKYYLRLALETGVSAAREKEIRHLLEELKGDGKK
jgi:phosphohistidine phosphatase